MSSENFCCKIHMNMVEFHREQSFYEISIQNFVWRSFRIAHNWMAYPLQYRCVKWNICIESISIVSSHKPVCVCRCFLSEKSNVKLLSHMWQANGRTPWCTASLCTFKMEARVNDLSHSSQAWGRSPEWASRCLLSPDAFEKLLSQILQIFDRIPWWMASLCCSKRYEWMNILSPNYDWDFEYTEKGLNEIIWNSMDICDL